VKLLNLNNTSLIKMVILEENFKWHLEAFASELLIYSFIMLINLMHTCSLKTVLQILFNNRLN